MKEEHENRPNRCASLAWRICRIAAEHYIVGKLVGITLEPVGHWLYEVVLRLFL
jgi:hypothetical protein